MKKILYTFVFLLFTGIFLQAQNGMYLKKKFIFKGDTLLYRVLFPDNYDRSKSYPLVLFLHGSGERGNDNEKQLLHGSSLFTDSLNRINYPAIVLFPQCPADTSWVTLQDTPDGKFNIIDTKKPAKPLGLAKRLVDYYIKTEAVDSKRIYILGISLGGMGTFDLICRYPKTFAAAIPVCGGVNPGRLRKIHKMPVRIYNGESDNVVSPEFSRSAYNALKRYDSGGVEHIEYSGIGHDSWTPAFAEPDFLKWLFSNKKNDK